MSTSHRIAFGLSLAWLPLTTACSATTAVTEIPADGTVDLALQPRYATLTLAMVADSGVVAIFTNHTSAAVLLNGMGCGALGTGVDRQRGGEWMALPIVPQFELCANNVVAPTVRPGDSTMVYARAARTDLVAGRYRLRLATSGGEAISTAVVIR